MAGDIESAALLWTFFCQEYVTFEDLAFGELPGEGDIRQFRFGKNHQTRSRFIEAVNYSEMSPAGLLVAKPFVNSFPGIRAWRMGIEPDRLVHNQDVGILVQDAGGRDTACPG